jgi:hypothetical protein
MAAAGGAAVPNLPTTTAAPSMALSLASAAADGTAPRDASALLRAASGGTCGGWPYEEQYRRLQRWAHASLDAYRPELVAVLWPTYAHVFLALVMGGHEERARVFLHEHRAEHEAMHGGAEGELGRLMEITRREQLPAPWGSGRADVAKDMLTHKFFVALSPASMGLLLTFLELHQLHLILSVLNEHVDFSVNPEEAAAAGAGAEAVGGGARGVAVYLRHKHARTVAGSAGRLQLVEASTVNRKKMSLGLLPSEQAISPEARRAAERTPSIAPPPPCFPPSSRTRRCLGHGKPSTQPLSRSGRMQGSKTRSVRQQGRAHRKRA